MILSIIVFVIVTYGMYKKVNIYDKFIEGAKDSFSMILSLFPCLLGMILSVNIFINSGIINYIFGFVKISILPIDVIPLALLRPLSSSSSLAILSNILNTHGPDSYIGTLASVMQGSTDTTIYILTLYFGSVGIKKIRYALWNGLLADLVAFIMALLVVSLLF